MNKPGRGWEFRFVNLWTARFGSWKIADGLLFIHIAIGFEHIAMVIFNLGFVIERE